MKRMVLFLVLFLVLPALANACYRLTTVVVPCDDCAGLGIPLQQCLGNVGSGASSCNPLGYISYCGEGDCAGDGYNATISGTCPDAKAQTALNLPRAAVLVPNSEGGYSESAIPRYSCAVRLGINP